MKTREMIKYLKEHGYEFDRNGKRHQLFTNGKRQVALPHGEFMKDRTALRIKKEIARAEKAEKEQLIN